MPIRDRPPRPRAPPRRRPPPSSAACVRRLRVARGPARRRHRPALPDVRAARPPRPAAGRATAGRVRLTGRGARMTEPFPREPLTRPPETVASPAGDGSVPSDAAAGASDSGDPGAFVPQRPPVVDAPSGGGAAVLSNRPFLLLWLSQAATQVGGNMVIYGMTLIVYTLTGAS